MAEINPLFERWPSLTDHISHVALGCWPTPVERFEHLETHGHGSVWIKREDLSSSHYGGNKVRKLEFLLARSSKPVVTFGASGSHHVLATAIHARRCGRSCIGVLVSEPTTDHHRDVLQLVHKYCAAIIPLVRPPVGGSNDWNPLAVAHLLRRGGFSIIAPGASSPRGTLGFVAAGIELADQIKLGLCPRPDRIYLPLGTGGTAAGLALGLGLRGVDTEIRAVRVATAATGNLTFLRLLALSAFRLLKKGGIPGDMPRLKISIEHNFIGPGYGRVTEEASHAVQLAKTLGLCLETTYTGKTMAALVADMKSGAIKGPTMMLNTYGSIDKIGNPDNRGGENTI